MSDSARALALAFACVLSWSFIAVVAKLGQVDLSNAQLLFWSNLLSMIVVGIAAAAMRVDLRQSAGRLAQCAALGFLGCFAYYLLLYYGYANENAILVLVTQYSWPALIVVFSAVLLGETLTAQRLFGLLLGTLSIMVTASKGDFSSLKVGNLDAVFAVLAGCVCFALFSVLSKKYRLDPIAGSFWFFAFAAGYSWLYCAANDGIGALSADNLLPVLVNGALINGLSYVLWIKALSLTSASRIAPLVFLAPVFAVVWVSLIFREQFHGAYFLGMALCVASGLLCVYESKNGKPATAT